MSQSTNANFNKPGCLASGEYVSEHNCPKCNSPIRKTKDDSCASCAKVNASKKITNGEFHRKRNAQQLARELAKINDEYDLLEY